jgi:hypothetical protein
MGNCSWIRANFTGVPIAWKKVDTRENDGKLRADFCRVNELNRIQVETLL